MKCPHCSADNPDSSVFCNKCGQRMVDPFAPSATGAPSATTSEDTPVDPWAAPPAASLASPSPENSDEPVPHEAQDPSSTPSAASFAAPLPDTDEPHFELEADEEGDQPWDAPTAERSEEFPLITPTDANAATETVWSAPTDASLAGSTAAESSANSEPFPDLMTFDDEPLTEVEESATDVGEYATDEGGETLELDSASPVDESASASAATTATLAAAAAPTFASFTPPPTDPSDPAYAQQFATRPALSPASSGGSQPPGTGGRGGGSDSGNNDSGNNDGDDPFTPEPNDPTPRRWGMGLAILVVTALIFAAGGWLLFNRQREDSAISAQATAARFR